MKNISFQAKPGQTVALVGSTGAGKTTIINLLNRFYDINSGTILYDETPITSFSLKSLRKNVAVVLQDVFLFADTILYNITLGNPKYTLKEVKPLPKKLEFMIL